MFMSRLLLAICPLLVSVCVIAAGAGAGSAAPHDDNPPATPPTATTTVDPNGNPWHG